MALKKGPAASNKADKEAAVSTHKMSTRQKDKQQAQIPAPAAKTTAASKPTHNAPTVNSRLRNLVGQVWSRTGSRVAGGLAVLGSAAGAVYFGYVDPASLLSSATTMGTDLLATAAGYGVTPTNAALALIPAAVVKSYDSYVSKKTDAKLAKDLSKLKGDNSKLDADVKKLQADLEKAQAEKDEAVEAEQEGQEDLEDLNKKYAKLEATNADLKAKNADLEKKQKTTAKKQTDLDAREEELNEREAELDEREEALDKRQSLLADEEVDEDEDQGEELQDEQARDSDSSASSEFPSSQRHAANDPTQVARTLTPARVLHAQRTQVPQVRSVADSTVGITLGSDADQGQRSPKPF